MDCISKPRRLRNGRRKTSVKITVSADLPSEGGRYFHSCESSFLSDSKAPHEILKKIIIEEDANNTREGNNEQGSNEGTTTAKTRVTVDDSIVDFPSCIDFGIQDFLCCKDEVDLELSNSDTDTSFLEATPPHRFSDSELESQIEIMSITLDTVLNMGSTPVAEWANRSMSKDDIFTVDLRVEQMEEDSGGGSGDQGDETQDENQEVMKEDESLRDKRDLLEDDTGKVATEEIKTLKDCGTKTDEQTKKIESASPLKKKRPPLRPFRRQISLPASIFMSYLLAAEKNLALNGDGQNNKKKDSPSDRQMQNNNPFKKMNNNNTSNGNRLILSKIDGSCSSSTESNEGSGNNEEYSVEGNPREIEIRSQLTSFDDSSLSSSTTATPIYVNGDEFSLGQNDLLSSRKDQSPISNRMSLDEGTDKNGRVDSAAAFTSEIERRSLLLRYMRRLIRQDTSTNFAPNDYCI